MKANGENSGTSGRGGASASAERQLSDELADIDLNDPELAQAAAKIQKQFRGFKKSTANANKQEPAPKSAQPSAEPSAKDAQKSEEDELADIDLTDPELAKAAVKIQSTFKGFKSRRNP